MLLRSLILGLIAWDRPALAEQTPRFRLGYEAPKPRPATTWLLSGGAEAGVLGGIGSIRPTRR